MSRPYNVGMTSPHRRVVVALAASIAIGGFAPAPAVAQPASPDPLAPVAFMAGCWSFTRGERTVHEQWMAPAGGVMLGMSRDVRAGRPASFEFALLRLVEGRIVYEARPEGQAPTQFTLTESAGTRAVFENPAHDFPQRIVYQRVGDELRARIEGPGPDGTRGIDYPFVRVACP